MDSRRQPTKKGSGKTHQDDPPDAVPPLERGHVAFVVGVRDREDVPDRRPRRRDPPQDHVHPPRTRLVIPGGGDAVVGEPLPVDEVDATHVRAVYRCVAKRNGLGEGTNGKEAGDGAVPSARAGAARGGKGLTCPGSSR